MKYDITVVAPRDPARRAGIVSLITADPARSSHRLDEAGVAHSLREGAIRLSPHVYNTGPEIQRALAVLDAP